METDVTVGKTEIKKELYSLKQQVAEQEKQNSKGFGK